MNYDLVVIGGGPAGLAAAIGAKKNGVKDILVIERDRELGGILQQCIHNGFGLHVFKEELTGPEYAERFINELELMGIEYKLDTMVLSIDENKCVTAMNTIDGLMHIITKTIILAMGCRERTRGAIAIAGYRPAGIFNAGTAQRYLNMEGYMVGKKILILGSGDIGLIMARRMTLEGAKVMAVAELMPFSGGLRRNIVQCLEDYDIPLMLSHTVTAINGKDRVESVVIQKVDHNLKPIVGTEVEYECDTLLLSVGLIPENELSKEAGVELDRNTSGPVVTESMETSIPGIFACGNVVHVHDLVDFVTEESQRAGKAVAKYILKESNLYSKTHKTLALNGIAYIVPQRFSVENLEEKLTLFYRVSKVFHMVELVVKLGEQIVYRVKKKYLTPGEMEQINIVVSKLKSFEFETLTIEIMEA